MKQFFQKLYERICSTFWFLYYKVARTLKLSNRVVTPTILQMEAAECGSASLNIVLSYYKKYIPAAELRYQCGVTRDGVNAFNISQTAKFYGLEGVGYSAEIDDLMNQIDYPAIIWWKRSHFLVLEGFSGDYAFLNDPATGPRYVVIDGFRKDYSGVVISCTPRRDFQAGGEKPKFFLPLLERLSKLQGVIAAFVALQFFLALTGITLAIFGQVFVDHFFYSSVPTWTSAFFWGLAGISILNGALLWLQGHILNRTGRKIAISLSTRFLWHVLRLPIPYFQQRFGGEVIRRMAINTRVSSIVAGEVGSLFVNICVLILYVFTIYQYDPFIAFFALLIGVLQLLLIIVSNRVRINAYARTEQDTAILTGISIDTVQNIESITFFGNDHFGFQRVMNSFVKILNRYQIIGKVEIFLSAASVFFTQSSRILILMLGGWKVMYGSLTVGMLLTLQILMQRMIQPLDRLVAISLMIPKLKIDLLRLDDVLENPIDPVIEKIEKKGTSPAKDQWKLSQEICFENITFGYSPQDDPLFENLNLTINAGQITGITGPNGSGKTTLTRLLTSQYLPWSGNVLFDGRNLLQEYPSWIHHNIALIESENLFLHGTIKENLTLWNSAFNQEMISHACSIAHIDREIESRFNKYLYKINEGASDFSEGQKQRLAVARAVLFKPQILIMDESFSYLDTDLQKAVMKSLASLNMTIIVISHRIHTLSHCQRVVVIDAGKVTQDESLENLLSAEGYFKNQFQEEYEFMKKEVF